LAGTIRSVPHPPTARLLLAAIALVAFCALARPSSADAGLNRPEARLFHKINDVRANHGLRRLKVGSGIQDASHGWARYLRKHDAFYHGRLAYGTSENVGWLTCRQGWARALVRMWLNSASHRPHLLDRSATRIGVGVATGPWGGYGCVRMAVTRFK
jgi:uncharacterized protein YkwD